MRPSLSAQQRIDAPATGHASTNASHVERIEHAQDLLSVHDPGHRESLTTHPEHASV